MSCLFEVVKSLIVENNREGLDKIFSELKGKLSGKQLLEKDVLALVGVDIFRDLLVESYFPEAVTSKNYIALSSLCTGDCLFSSVSLSLFGNNRYCDELRILSCIELFLHADYYSKHPSLISTFQKYKDENTFTSFNCVLTCCVTDKTLKFFDENNLEYNPIELCKREAIVCCKKRVWASFLSIFALSSVLERCIETFYPDKCSSKRYVYIFNEKSIIPRGTDEFNSEITSINLLFCRSSPPPAKSSKFLPNHYVPLIPVKKHIKKSSVKSIASTMLFSIKKKTNIPNRFIHQYFKKSEKKSNSSSTCSQGKNSQYDVMSIGDSDNLSHKNLFPSSESLISVGSPVMVNSKVNLSEDSDNVSKMSFSVG